MNCVALTYVDDSLDPFLSDYLADYSYDGATIDFREYEFEDDCSYRKLLDAEEIRNANCIIIDSKLFEEKTASNGKFSGEEFELILRRLYPYIEVIVISSKEVEPGYSIVPKWTSKRFSASDDAINHYDNVLKPNIDSAIKRTLQFRVLAERLRDGTEDAVDDVDLLNSITASLSGVFEYETLNSAKIDQLIDAFKNIKELVDGERL